MFGAVCLTILSPVLVDCLPIETISKEYMLLEIFHPVKILSTILMVSIGSFLIRFFSKQYSSQQHLSLEAVERQTMLKTYIGLMENGKLDEHEDRKIALDTMFRPAQTGIITDYSNITPTESIVRLLDKSGVGTHKT